MVFKALTLMVKAFLVGQFNFIKQEKQDENMKKHTIEDDIHQELTEKGSFPIHNGYDQSTYQALRKLNAWDLIEPSPSNTKYTLTKEGHILLDSGKSFDELVHPSWKTKTWNISQKILGPGLVLAIRKLLGLI